MHPLVAAVTDLLDLAGIQGRFVNLQFYMSTGLVEVHEMDRERTAQIGGCFVLKNARIVNPDLVASIRYIDNQSG